MKIQYNGNGKIKVMGIQVFVVQLPQLSLFLKMLIIKYGEI